jgi:cysteine-rich repeat protein
MARRSTYLLFMLMACCAGCSLVVDKKLENNENSALTTCSEENVCNDGNECNALETCNPKAENTNRLGCINGNPAPDGKTCDSDGNPNSFEICVAGSCRTKGCGDGFVDAPLELLTPGELCDDGNQRDDDGCKSDCTFTCVADADCSNPDTYHVSCITPATCNVEAHRCREGTLLTGNACVLGNQTFTCYKGDCLEGNL